MNEKLLDRIDTLDEALNDMLPNNYATLLTSDGEINVVKGKSKVCSVEIREECYWIKTGRLDWKEKTTYSGAVAGEVFGYSVDSIDECLGEIERMVKVPTRHGLSELRNKFTDEKFTVAYKKFMKQAEDNFKTGKSFGSKIPEGLNNDDIFFDGKRLMCHYGQGAASKAPYMSWHVVSIYYVVSERRIIIGIEENRYRHVKEMASKVYDQVGNKKELVAFFYQTTELNVDFHELYKCFIDTCEEVMDLGLE